MILLAIKMQQSTRFLLSKLELRTVNSWWLLCAQIVVDCRGHLLGRLSLRGSPISWHSVWIQGFSTQQGSTIPYKSEKQELLSIVHYQFIDLISQMQNTEQKPRRSQPLGPRVSLQIGGYRVHRVYRVPSSSPEAWHRSWPRSCWMVSLAAQSRWCCPAPGILVSLYSSIIYLAIL